MTTQQHLGVLLVLLAIWTAGTISDSADNRLLRFLIVNAILLIGGALLLVDV